MPSTQEMRPSCACPLKNVGETLKEVLLAPPDEIVWSSHSKWLFSCYLFILLHQPLLHPHDYPIPLITSSISCSVVSCDPMDCSTRGLPVHYQLPEFTQTHVHRVSDAIQPSHPLSSPSTPALSLSQHPGLFKWVSCLHQVAKVLEFQLQHQSFQWTPRTDLL